MKILAGVWVSSLPKEMERKSILGVEFAPYELVDRETWEPYYTLPSNREHSGKNSLAMTQIEVRDTSWTTLIEVARKIVYPRVRRAALVVDIARLYGHTYVSREVTFQTDKVPFSTWVGQAELGEDKPKKELADLLEGFFVKSKDRSFVRRIENALIAWGEAREEPDEYLRTAKSWTALEALLKSKDEPVWKTVCRRSIALTMIENIETTLRIPSWRSEYGETNLEAKIKKILRWTFDVRNTVFHSSEEVAVPTGFSGEVHFFVRMCILKMTELAQRGYTWDQTIKEIDRKAQELRITA